VSTFKLLETEAMFQARVQDYARLRGWEWMHLQRALNDRGYWRTPVVGTLGNGWPDLILVKGHRMIAAELKVGRGVVSPKQERVLGVLTGLGYVEVYVWRPEDWDLITEVLDR